MVNTVLSISAFLGNTLIQVALRKEMSLHPPLRLLLPTLSVSDLCVGLVSEPLVVTYWLTVVNEQRSIYRYALTSTFIATYILTPVSLLTLTAISVDRLLALLLSLRYRQVVTLKRTVVVAVTSFWFLCAIGATMYFWNFQITLWFGNICTTLCLLTTTVCYTKIFFCLHHHQNEVQDLVHPRTTKPNESTKYSVIQKGSFQCIEAAVDIGSLLSTSGNNCGIVDKPCRVLANFLPCSAICVDFCFL